MRTFRENAAWNGVTWPANVSGDLTTWTYDAASGLVTSKTDAKGKSVNYTYTVDGKLASRTWARGIVTTYTYDNAGRLLTQSYSDNTPGITATYDYLDRIVSLTDASGTRNFTYNAQHLLVNETIPHIMNLQSSFTYDNFGRRTSRTLQMDNTTVSTAGRSYDTFGRIASISNGTDTLSYTYRLGGQLSLSGWTNGQNSAMSNQSYEYDQYNRLTGIKLNNINEVSYTLNAKDQRTAATYANAGLWNFTYDDKGQVTGANGSSKSYTYSYDGIGNRLTANENSTITNYTSNLLNQYTLINNTAPEYDADGNMTSSGNGWVYTYNGENRITQATKGSTTVTMAYDYAGRRISKTVTESGVVQNSYKYVYDGFKLIAVYNNNDLVMTFTWQPESLGMDVPISMTYSGATYYYVTDGNKNVTALLDASGNRVAEYVYGPFGQTVSATGSMAQINPFRFSSEFHDDETGLVYYNYRYYSPELGRWTKRDPIEEDGGVNMYSVLHNDMYDFFDLLGLDEHHIIPKSLWKKYFPTSMRSWLNKKVVHTTSHNFTRHSVYNAVVEKKIMDLYPKGIKNQEEAQELLMVITNKCKFTKIFNQKAKKGPKAVAAWFDKYGYKYVPVKLQEKVARTLRYSKNSQGIKKISGSAAKKILLGLTIYNASIMALEGAENKDIAAYIYDDLTFGLGSVASEKYWETAYSMADGIVAQKAFPWLEEDFLNTRNPLQYQIPDFDKKEGPLRAVDYLHQDSWWMFIIDSFKK